MYTHKRKTSKITQREKEVGYRERFHSLLTTKVQDDRRGNGLVQIPSTALLDSFGEAMG